ncbi:hypothetical protein EYR40_004277 [Pleurotus pulmonarius]|nr:hypothetical protein EYR40_004277 [Pleurotus pulmonarius]KAF4606982.1 hypothetical protein EYR38_001037 [Pleurotus pulmonarius]
MSDSFSGTVTELGSEAGASTVTEPLDPDAPPPRPKPTKLYSWRARNPDAELLYIRDIDVANLELDRLSTLSAVGFDQEWRPTFIKGLPENPVSLIQLASDELVLLIQVSAMNEIPEKLIQILENPDIVKAGVGIQGDVHKLYKDHKVNVKNCVDLSLLARSADNPRWKGKYNSSIGLARLIEEYEDETLQKGKITRSNWEAILSTAQQLYAANDAHAGLTLYNRLGAMARSIDTLKPVYYTFDCVRGRLCEPSGAQWRVDRVDTGPTITVIELKIASGLTQIQVLVTAMLHICRDSRDLVQRHHRAKPCPFLSNRIFGLIAPTIVGVHLILLLLGDSRSEEGVAEEEEEAKREPKFSIPNQLRSRLPGARCRQTRLKCIRLMPCMYRVYMYRVDLELGSLTTVLPSTTRSNVHRIQFMVPTHRTHRAKAPSPGFSNISHLFLRVLLADVGWPFVSSPAGFSKF